MALWSVVLLAVSVAFLAYRQTSKMLRYLPPWLRSNAVNSEPNENDQNTNSSVDEGKEEAQPDIRVDVIDSDTETTPKASVSKANGAVPTFSLSEDAEEEQELCYPSRTGASSFPAVNSPHRASAMPPPSKPTTPALAEPNKSQRKSAMMPPPPGPAAVSPQKPASVLMPPPERPTPTLRGLAPGSAGSLRVPTTGPLPNRGPPGNSQQRVSSSLSPNPAIKTSNTRGQVLLKPGHSPMDWAALTRSSSSNLSGVSTFQRVTPSQLRKMTGRKGKPAWSSWQGKVYNITPYVDFHPGGEPEIMKGAGRDGEKLFMDVHPWVNWENMLGACLVGVMVPEGHYDGARGDGESELEGLD